jgi:hypothetical protein
MSNYGKNRPGATLQPIEYIGSLEEINQLILQGSSIIPHAEYTLQDIANMCGLSRERIRQIEANAIKKIKALLRLPRNRVSRLELHEYAMSGTRCMLDIAQMQHYNLVHMSTNKSKMEQAYEW